MRQPNGIPVVCQACGSRLRRLNHQYARWSEALTPSAFESVSIDTMLSLTNEMDALNQARYRVLHGCTHLN